MHFISLSLLVLGALTVSHAQDDLDSHEVLKRLLSALTEKKQEEPVVHKSLWDELEEELTKRKEAVNIILSLLLTLFLQHTYQKIHVECQRLACRQM